MVTEIFIHDNTHTSLVIMLDKKHDCSCKVYVGKGIKYFSNIGVAEFLVEAAGFRNGIGSTGKRIWKN